VGSNQTQATRCQPWTDGLATVRDSEAWLKPFALDHCEFTNVHIRGAYVAAPLSLVVIAK